MTTVHPQRAANRNEMEKPSCSTSFVSHWRRSIVALVVSASMAHRRSPPRTTQSAVGFGGPERTRTTMAAPASACVWITVYGTGGSAAEAIFSAASDRFQWGLSWFPLG
jgi:hypothetical protein